MPEQESIHQLQTEIQTLKIKDEFRTKELDALMKKLSETSTKLNTLSENIGRLLAGQELHKTNDNEVRDEIIVRFNNIPPNQPLGITDGEPTQEPTGAATEGPVATSTGGGN